MPVFKDEKTNKWYAMVRFTDWQGQRRQKCKRGFATHRDALEWEKVFQMQMTSDMDTSFEAFVELYRAERQPRLKQTTWMTKENIINSKISRSASFAECMMRHIYRKPCFLFMCEP